MRSTCNLALLLMVVLLGSHPAHAYTPKPKVADGYELYFDGEYRFWTSFGSAFMVDQDETEWDPGAQGFERLRMHFGIVYKPIAFHLEGDLCGHALWRLPHIGVYR